MLERTWRPESIVDFIKLALAGLLIVAPWYFGFASDSVASGNAWISGAAIGLASIAAIVALADWEEWVSLAFGVWVVISPWVLGFHATIPSAVRVDVAVGVAVAFFAAAALLMAHRRPPQVTA